MISAPLLVTGRLVTLLVALVVAAAGVRWIGRGDRRGWLLIAASAVRLLARAGGAAIVATTWFEPAHALPITLAVAGIEGALTAGAWALLLVGLLAPAPHLSD